MNKAGKKEVAAAAAAIIFANEGGYTSINANDNGAVSVGKMQWHGNRALSLLKTIVQKMGQTTAANILGITLCNEILTAANWQTRTGQSGTGCTGGNRYFTLCIQWGKVGN